MVSKLRVEQLETLDGVNTKDVATLIDDINTVQVTTSTGTQDLHEALDDRALLANSVINVKYYGAVGDGSTDDTSAIQQAIDASQGQSVHIPAGEYLLTSTITWDGKNVPIYGDSKESTSLVWDGVSTGLSVGGTTPVDALYLRGISFLTKDSTTSGSAVDATLTVNARPTTVVEDCFFAGYNAESNNHSTYWWEGLVLHNALQPVILRCEFLGANPGGTVSGNQQANAGIHLTADAEAVIPKIVECHTLFLNYAVLFESSTEPSIEGISVISCDFVFCNTGVRGNFTHGTYKPPQVNISGTHCEAFERAVHLTNCKEVNIAQCLFYSYNEGFSDALIFLDGVDEAIVSGNTLVARPNSTDCRGVLLSGCTHVNVFDNVIDTVSTHIGFVEGTTACKEYDNTLLGSGDRTGDTGSGNIQGWIKDSDEVSFFQPDSGIMVQAGTIGTDADGSGDINVTFQRAFPNAIVTAFAVNGDTSAESTPIIGVRGLTTSGFVVSTGERNSPQRVNWFAYGY